MKKIIFVILFLVIVLTGLWFWNERREAKTGCDNLWCEDCYGSGAN